MALIYLDSGVLIAAARSEAQGHRSALDLLAGDFEFASSDLVKLEILPKAVYYNHRSEQDFYTAFFKTAAAWAMLDQGLAARALGLAERFGLAAMDALHIAAAVRLGADEFVTAERPTSPLLRVTDIPVRTLAAQAS